MQVRMKLLFTGISAALAVLGGLAIVTQSARVSPRFEGVRTILGDDAVWLGKTSLLLAVLPLLVWLPARWVGIAITLWWLALMVWLFAPFFIR